MSKDFSNFVPAYGDPSEVAFRTGGNSITDQHPFQGETYGLITAAEVRETPDGFETPGLPAIDITLTCDEPEAKGKRVVKMLIMDGESKDRNGTPKPNIETFRQLIASIASTNPEVTDKAGLEKAARQLYGQAIRQGALPNLAKWLVGKKVYYTVKDKEITPKKGSGRTFSSSTFEYMSNRLTYEGKKKDSMHHRGNESFVAALASGASKTSLADTALSTNDTPDFSMLNQ